MSICAQVQVSQQCLRYSTVTWALKEETHAVTCWRCCLRSSFPFGQFLASLVTTEISFWIRWILLLLHMHQNHRVHVPQISLCQCQKCLEHFRMSYTHAGGEDLHSICMLFTPVRIKHMYALYARDSVRMLYACSLSKNYQKYRQVLGTSPST